MPFLKNLAFCMIYNLDLERNTHALIIITEKIRSALDAGKVTCGIFIDLQKAFWHS